LNLMASELLPRFRELNGVSVPRLPNWMDVSREWSAFMADENFVRLKNEREMPLYVSRATTDGFLSHRDDRLGYGDCTHHDAVQCAEISECPPCLSMVMGFREMSAYGKHRFHIFMIGLTECVRAMDYYISFGAVAEMNLRVDETGSVEVIVMATLPVIDWSKSSKSVVAYMGFQIQEEWGKILLDLCQGPAVMEMLRKGTRVIRRCPDFAHFNQTKREIKLGIGQILNNRQLCLDHGLDEEALKPVALLSQTASKRTVTHFVWWWLLLRRQKNYVVIDDSESENAQVLYGDVTAFQVEASGVDVTLVYSGGEYSTDIGNKVVRGVKAGHVVRAAYGYMLSQRMDESDNTVYLDSVSKFSGVKVVDN